MANIKQVTRGVFFFIFAWMIIITAWYVIPALLDVVQGVGTWSTGLTAVFWGGLIMLTIVLGAIVPISMILSGFKNEGE